MTEQEDDNSRNKWLILKKSLEELCNEASPAVPIPAGVILAAMETLDNYNGLYSPDDMALKILKRGPNGEIAPPDLEPPETIKCELCDKEFYPAGNEDPNLIREEYTDMFPEEKKVVPPAIICNTCYHELVKETDPAKWRVKWENAINKGWYKIKPRDLPKPSNGAKAIEAERKKKPRKKNKIIPDLTSGYYEEPEDKDTDYENYQDEKESQSDAMNFVKKFLDDD